LRLDLAEAENLIRTVPEAVFERARVALSRPLPPTLAAVLSSRAVYIRAVRASCRSAAA
jgi:hypothetical protein